MIKLPLISSSDFVSIIELTVMLKIIDKFDLKHMTLPIKTITSVLKRLDTMWY